MLSFAKHKCNVIIFFYLKYGPDVPEKRLKKCDVDVHTFFDLTANKRVV